MKKKTSLPDFIEGLLNGEVTKKEAAKIWDNVDLGTKAYENDVKKMSNKDLYEHVYDGDYNPEDFASKELNRRGIDKDGCYPCNQCQGGGCPNCTGFGVIPAF